jgi:hypothetical protein
MSSQKHALLCGVQLVLYRQADSPVASIYSSQLFERPAQNPEMLLCAPAAAIRAA